MLSCIKSWCVQPLLQEGNESWKELLVDFGGKSMGKRKGFISCEWLNLCDLKDNGVMGFQSLTKFNLVLLAEQCWRLMTNTNTLLVRSLKAKYYSKSDFMSSNLRAYTSYT
ncbi:reverse transcriptase [Gossypium australe]|uniref:Reverse transcriptase n=1 Tax=Gossypium australe TaxID=47621 RepID=A0A5B6VPL5_9ROSI|nr:reverse transcriptase [Gossypium australe]